jgi:nucleotide-binding universal stress UspA family protein
MKTTKQVAGNFDHRKDERPIVCGTDFSPTAREAVDLAAALAERLGTKLVLVHVEEFHGLAAVDPTLFEEALSQNRGVFDREVARLRQSGVRVEGQLKSGSAFDELVNTAVDCGARLIVLGAVGHGLPRRLLVGSVAERVAETSSVPTLVMRPGSNLGSWIKTERPLRILVGYDFSAAGDAALSWIREMQDLGSCEVTVEYVDWPPEQARRLDYHGALPLTKNPNKIQKVLEQDLAQHVAQFLPREQVKIVVAPGWGSTEGYLFEMAHRQKADLVVVGTHRRHGLGRLWFGSVSRSILHTVNVSVAVVPSVEVEGPLAAAGSDRGSVVQASVKKTEPLVTVGQD